MRLLVQRAQRTLVRDVASGGSYQGQNDLRVHFGLGGATKVDRLEVRWPNGLEETWTDVEINRLVTLKEGMGRPAEPGTKQP